MTAVDVTDADFWSDFGDENSDGDDVFRKSDHYARELTRDRYASLGMERDSLAAAVRSGSRMRVAAAVDAVAAAIARVDREAA